MMAQREPSPELRAANERLMRLRAEYRAERSQPGDSYPGLPAFSPESLHLSNFTRRVELSPAGSHPGTRF